MSMSNSHVRCHGCNFEAVIARRAVTLLYLLSDGRTVEGRRQLAWCDSCANVTDAEEAIDTEAIRVSLEIAEKRRGSLLRRLFGRSADDAAELESLRSKVFLARHRNSPPRCLRCGDATVRPLRFDIGGSSEIVHACGGKLYLVPEDPDAPRFMYKPQVIRLDSEGRKIS